MRVYNELGVRRSHSTHRRTQRNKHGAKMRLHQEFISVAMQSGAAGTSYKPYELGRYDKQMLRSILHSDPFLLFNEYEGCDTVWRWLIRHDYFLIIEFILDEAIGQYGISWCIPSNRFDKNDGSTIFTDHSLILTARLFHLLFTESEEKLHLYNKETNETVLHKLVKQDLRKNTALEILRTIVVENSMDLDPDLIDFAGKTALHYALERGNLRTAELLVERIGADWDLAMVSDPPVSNETLASRHPECVEFLQKCKDKYSIKPNSEGCWETCSICLSKIKGSAYLMQCCANKLHTACLRKYLARAEAPSCTVCRRDIREGVDKDLYDRVPNTVFKSKWEEKQAEAVGTGSTHNNLPSTAPPMDSPDSLIEEKLVIFNGRYNFFGQKVANGLPEMTIPPNCEEIFASRSIMFENGFDSFLAGRRRMFNMLNPMHPTSFVSLPKYKVDTFLHTVRALCRDLYPLHSLSLFANVCANTICDVYGMSPTSSFGLLLNKYVKKRMEDEGERNVLAVQLMRIHYEEMFSDVGGNENSFVQHKKNMAEWLYIRDLHIETREKTKMLHFEMLTMLKNINNATNLYDFDRLLAAIDRILSVLYGATLVPDGCR